MTRKVSHKSFVTVLHSYEFILFDRLLSGRTHFWSPVRLKWYKLLKRHLNPSFFDDVLQGFSFLGSHLIVELIVLTYNFWLLFSKINIKSFCWFVQGPQRPFLIKQKVQDVQRMSEIDEAVWSIYNLHGLLIEGHLDIVVPSFVILVNKFLNLFLFVATWNILNHYICACFKTGQYGLRNDRSHFFVDRMIVRISRARNVSRILPVHQVLVLSWVIVLVRCPN